MNKLLSRLPKPSFGVTAFAVLALAFLYMSLRNAGLYPSVMGDEWTYSSAARLEAFRDAIIPNYLYYSVFGVTKQCGTASLECARSLNALFFLGAAPFLYLLARRVASRPVACAVALLAVLRPANSYTAYFMPEAMYYCGFWLLTWSAFNIQRQPGWRTILTSAAILGLLSMVKVHALFLLPGWCLFLVFVVATTTPQPGWRHWLLPALRYLAGALALAALLRFSIGYLFAGKQGLQLLGAMYSGQAQGKPSLLAILPEALRNLEGHLSGLLLMLMLPFATLLAGLSRPLRRSQQAGLRALAVYTVLMLGALLAVTVLFTASVAGYGAESNARLHMRYYDFVLPLLLLLAAGHTAPMAQEPSRRARLLAALPVAIAAVYGLCFVLGKFSPSFIDCPELFGMSHKRGLMNLLTVLGLLCLAIWVKQRRQGALLFLFVFAPLCTILASVQLNREIRWQQNADLYIKAGLFARDYLSHEETDRLTLVGKDAGELFKARFMIDNPKVKLLVLPHGSEIKLEDLGGPRSYTMLIGDYRAPDQVQVLLQRRDFDLLHIPDPKEVKMVMFGHPQYEWGLRYSKGLSGAEPWGRWSEGKQVKLEFADAMTTPFALHLEAAAFGPNIDQPFIVRWGSQQRELRLGPKPSDVVLEFDASDARELTIEVPHPASPRDIGQGDDTRQLGIALHRLQRVPHQAIARAAQ
jgi:phosphoglycerol transferase